MAVKFLKLGRLIDDATTDRTRSKLQIDSKSQNWRSRNVLDVNSLSRTQVRLGASVSYWLTHTPCS